MTPEGWALAAAAPLVLLHAAAFWRSGDSRSLDDVPADPPPDPPLVSVVVPARNEARSIARCVESVLASAWPRLEVVVVDDHSTDGTGDIARAIGARDPRVRVVANPALPPDWFGKQWALANGVRASRGELLCFVDADTVQTPDLVPRAVRLLRDRGADAVTVLGHQELGSAWERIVQPQIFGFLLSVYGGTERINRARDPRRKIANGQFILATRASYDAVGGHEAVRDTVAEDLMLAQRYCAEGLRMVAVLGETQLRTRMYQSFGEIVRGWGKNVYAGGIRAAPFGRVGRALFPLALVAPWLVALAPPVALLAAALGAVPAAVGLWGAVGTAAALAYWMAVYHRARQPVWYALLYPVGAAVALGIVLAAIARGERVAWKGRSYRAAT